MFVNLFRAPLGAPMRLDAVNDLVTAAAEHAPEPAHCAPISYGIRLLSTSSTGNGLTYLARDTVSGPEHPDTLITWRNLAYWTKKAERGPGQA